MKTLGPPAVVGRVASGSACSGSRGSRPVSSYRAGVRLADPRTSNTTHSSWRLEFEPNPPYSANAGPSP